MGVSGSVFSVFFCFFFLYFDCLNENILTASTSVYLNGHDCLIWNISTTPTSVYLEDPNCLIWNRWSLSLLLFICIVIIFLIETYLLPLIIAKLWLFQVQWLSLGWCSLFCEQCSGCVTLIRDHNDCLLQV